VQHGFVGGYSEAPPLGLDHERFAYAGKFDGKEGKFLTRDGADLVAALSFSPDRAHENAARIRYIDVRRDRRNEGIASSLLRYAADSLHRRYDTVRIGVNRPFAYAAAYNADFGWTGETSGIAELVMEHPAPEDDRYEEGLREFVGRDLSEDGEEFVRRRLRE